MWGLRAVTNIKDSFISLVMYSLLASMPTTQLSVKATQESPSSLIDLNTLATIMGLKTFNSKCPLKGEFGFHSSSFAQ